MTPRSWHSAMAAESCARISKRARARSSCLRARAPPRACRLRRMGRAAAAPARRHSASAPPRAPAARRDSDARRATLRRLPPLSDAAPRRSFRGAPHDDDGGYLRLRERCHEGQHFVEREDVGATAEEGGAGRAHRWRAARGEIATEIADARRQLCPWELAQSASTSSPLLPRAASARASRRAAAHADSARRRRACPHDGSSPSPQASCATRRAVRLTSTRWSRRWRRRDLARCGVERGRCE